MKDFKTIPFDRSDRDFQLLYDLEKSLDDHVGNFGSVLFTFIKLLDYN